MGALIRARLASSPPIEWAAAGRALPGEHESGDLHVVSPFPRGILIAVIDGLGHGPEAARAARLAGSVLEARPAAAPADLVVECHERLRGSRGVVMSVASIDGATGEMTWVGMGNVEGLHLDGAARRGLPLRGAVIGVQMSRPAPATIRLSQGDLVVVATDGIRGDFAATVPAGASPDVVADHVLGCCARDTDDALVVAFRLQGPGP